MNILDHATNFLQLGISIIPITYRDKRPNFRLLPRDENDNPTWEPYKTSLPDLWTVQQWFTKPSNYGVVCGWSGLVVLDFDEMGEYNSWHMWASKSGGVAHQVASQAFRVSSSRGAHVYIRLPHREKNRKVGKIDIKADGYVLGPGSVHPSGAVYTAMREVYNLPMVEALSDVLPSALLVPHTQQASAPTASVWQPRPVHHAPGQGLVKQIRDNFRIEDLLPAARQTGDHWMMTCCPLHDDHSPSMWMDTERQICGCFSGCTPKPLDVINLFARLHGLTNSDAIFEMGRKLT